MKRIIFSNFKLQIENQKLKKEIIIEKQSAEKLKKNIEKIQSEYQSLLKEVKELSKEYKKLLTEMAIERKKFTNECKTFLKKEKK